MKKIDESVYCSLDIETSGFDPLKDEILEVGFVLFKIEDLRFKVLEEWTQVFKPTKPVEAKILGLTGIKQEELDAAPDFNEFKELIQDKINGAVIVGHNVVFDIKFLESQGIKFSGKIIDTLDLVQWLLPTHHSYNLENLMHFFGVAHKDAHRALADAKATLEVLKHLLHIYQGFSEELKEKINKVLKQQDFEFKKLLIGLKKPTLSALKPNKKTKPKKANKGVLKLEPKHIYNFRMGQDPVLEILPALESLKKTSLVVLPKKQAVIKLCKEEHLNAVWQTDQLFDKKRFTQFLKKKLSPDEAKFVLKVLVWENINWQNESLIDLNLSFFGGQFKQEVTGTVKQDFHKHKILVCDIFTFLNLKETDAFVGRQIVFAGLAEFENAISLNQSDRVGWGQINYLLKNIYNPDLKTGKTEKKEEVEELLNASDLFFGLVSALLQTDPPTFLDVAVTEEFKLQTTYLKIKNAAENFADKLAKGAESLETESLLKLSRNLVNFFDESANRVKWLELSDKRCVFNNAPLKIDGVAEKIFLKFPDSLFIDALSAKEVLNYFADRLGIKSWPYKKLSVGENKVWDLFVNLKKTKFVLEAAVPSPNDLIKLVSKKELPAAILFGSPKSLKEFYDESYQELKTYSSLLSQTGSGSNKLFNNFGINKNALLLATDRTILKALTNVAENSRPQKLEVKTLIILRLPFDPVSHPYNQALSQTYPNAFMAMAMPKALYNLHQLLSLFYTNQLKNVYLFDQKLNKDYTKPFYSYFDEING